MRSFVLLLAAVALMTGTARGDWTEDWEAYSKSEAISNQPVWDVPGTVGGMIWPGMGEAGQYNQTWGTTDGDGAASMGAGTWNWGTAFKQNEEPNLPVVATARVYVEPGNYHAIRLGLSPHALVGGNGGFDKPAGPLVEIRLQADNVGVAQWNMRTMDEGSGEADTFAGALTDTWYEIRLTDNGNGTVTGEYREMNILAPPPQVKVLPSGPWVEIATMSAMGAWNAGYLFISGLRQGVVDDIKVTGRGYWGGDVNRDFHVDLEDFAVQASQWLNCNDPFQPVLCTDVP